MGFFGGLAGEIPGDPGDPGLLRAFIVLATQPLQEGVRARPRALRRARAPRAGSHLQNRLEFVEASRRRLRASTATRSRRPTVRTPGCMVKPRMVTDAMISGPPRGPGAIPDTITPPVGGTCSRHPFPAREEMTLSSHRADAGNLQRPPVQSHRAIHPYLDLNERVRVIRRRTCCAVPGCHLGKRRLSCVLRCLVRQRFVTPWLTFCQPLPTPKVYASWSQKRPLHHVQAPGRCHSASAPPPDDGGDEPPLRYRSD